MEERLIRFARIVDAGSLTKAAVLMRVSQPALSVMVATLERDLGASLLVRRSRPLRLTEAGRKAYLAAKDIAAVSGNLRSELESVTGEHQSLAIGMNDSIAAALLSDDVAISQLQDRADVSIVVDNSRFLYDAVVEDRLDAVFAVGGAATSPLLTVRDIGMEKMVLVSVASYGGAGRQPQAAGLRDFISYDRRSMTARLIMARLSSRGILAEPAFYSTSPEVMLRLVLLGKGVAVLPWMQVEPYIQRKELRLMSWAGGPVIIDRPVVYVTRRRRRLPTALDGLVEKVRFVLSDSYHSIRASSLGKHA